MSTKYRTQSRANIYHVTARGVARQIIFEDDEDRRFFGRRMRLLLAENDVRLYAWCFMSNHVHLLLKADIVALTAFMQKLLTTYAIYFNRRHGRSGHLFQNRFDSVPIDSDEQFMVAVRYIHRNPSEIPGQSYESYEWSSYREYLGNPFISETDFPLKVFGSLESFVAFNQSWDSSLDNGKSSDTAHKMISDSEAVELAKHLLDVDSIAEISAFDKQKRNRCLIQLKKNGLPIVQISRITGIGRNIVQRAK